jgi:hypothetical protein
MTIRDLILDKLHTRAGSETELNGKTFEEIHNLDDVDLLEFYTAARSADDLIDRIADAAEGACFYVTPAGLWLRMDFCEMDEGYFQAHDEDSGEEYRITFEEVAQEEDPHFEHLVKTVI